MIDCNHLRGRLREICEGVDAFGDRIDMLQDDRVRSLIAIKVMIPGVTDSEIIAHVHTLHANSTPGSILRGTSGTGASVAGSQVEDCSDAGTLMLAAIEEETGQRISCGSCRAYLASLNRMPNHDRVAIEQKLYAEIAWPPLWREKYKDKETQKSRIAEIVYGVLAIATTTCKTPRPVRPPFTRGGRQNSSRSYTGWRSEADGPRIEHGPFVSSIRHLTYFVYPKTEDSWKWNLQELSKRWELFNGKRILGIASDDQSAKPQAVIDYAASLGMTFDHVLVAKNKAKLREVVLFEPMLKLLHPQSAGENEVVFSGHAKGQKYIDSSYTRDWADVMYRVNLDHWPSVENALSTSLFAGAFREYGLFHRGFDWIYSGTFYWWRLAEIGKRQWNNVDQWFGGTESWPGKLCDPRESACLFMNNSTRLYDKSYWKNAVWPAWHQRQALLAQPPEKDPFIGEPVVHFGAHLYPIKGKWDWHSDRWNEIASNINGLCIVGVATDATTDTIEDVRAKLSDRFEIVSMANSPEGEAPTFRMLQERIPQGVDDVLLYAHGKGVTAKPQCAESVRIWTEIMYETVINNTERVIEKLSEGYKAVGSFQWFVNGWNMVGRTGVWHYAGTFFAVRARYLASRPVRAHYHGVEAWCGDIMGLGEAWSEFDIPIHIDPYYLVDHPEVVASTFDWEVCRIGGPRCEQHKRELDWFLEKLLPDSRVLVIGSRNGGLEHQLEKRGHSTVSIDIAPQPDNAVTRMIIGSSTDPEVQRKARESGPFDVVFIDGDHSYAGAKADWEFSKTLCPAMIALHDVGVPAKHLRKGCHVDPLWAEIKATHQTDEKIVGCGWGGIGVVTL
jgi:hypothetical protein